MKPFNLEAAKRGEPICTREGEAAKFVAHVPDAVRKDSRVVVLIIDTGEVEMYCEDGTYQPNSQPSQQDLFMAPRAVWVNLYESEERHGYYSESEEEANRAADPTLKRIGGKAWRVEIEE